MQDLIGWWLGLTLVVAPWAYGATFPETRDWLALALCALSVPFALSLILRRRWPRIGLVSLLLSLVILAQGWLMTWNAKLVFDPRVLFFHAIPQPVPWLPGTVDQAISWNQMLLITGLFCAFCVASDLAARERWRRRLWLIMSLTGVSLMLLGLSQRLTAAPGIFWRTDLDCGTTFFATYRYHANAGAFINLIFPLVAAQSIAAFRKGSSHLARAYWPLAALVVLVSAFVNVSRAASIITFCIAGIFCLWQLVEVLRTRRRFSKGLVVVIAIIVLVGVVALVGLVGVGDAYKRWTDPRYNIVSDARFSVYDVLEHRVIPAAGWFGFGPATFQLIFPFFTNPWGARIPGYWEEAHQDYLQTLVEWGFLGAAVWFIFFGNTLIRAMWTFWQRKRTWDGTTRTFALACLLALISVLVHSAIDFPLQIASLQLYTAVILGFLASLKYSDSGQVRSRRSRLISVSAGAVGDAGALSPRTHVEPSEADGAARTEHAQPTSKKERGVKSRETHST